MGRTQPDHDIGIDLRNAREKTATGNLTNTHDVQHMNEGRHDGMPHVLRNKGVDPDVHHAGGVPVVVRGRESLPHGEGEQFELLGVQIT